MSLNGGVDTIRPIIFIVDSDETLLKKLTVLFSVLAVDVKCFTDAESFLKLPATEQRCCLLVEVSLPKISGIELVEKLSSQGRNIPTIIWATYSDIPMAVRAMKAHAVDFVEKPIVEPLLLKQVEKLITNQP